jgi:hypothetical protein
MACFVSGHDFSRAENGIEFFRSQFSRPEMVDEK